RRILLLAIALEVLLILGVAGAFALRLRHPAATPRPGPGATATAGAATSAGGGGTATAAAPPPVAPSTAASMTPGSALPAGWHYVHDATGFTVAVPDGWTRTDRDGIAYFHDPAGGRLLGVDQSSQPKPDPVADWREQ